MNRACVLWPVAWCLAVVLNCLSAVDGAAAEAGRVAEVILYDGQAMVTRVIPVAGPIGTSEVVVGDLPEQIVPESLFAEGTDTVQIRAVRYRTEAVGDEPREEVRQLDTKIEAVNEQLDATRKSIETLAKRAAYLDQLEGFVAPTAKVELSQGVLDAEALKQVTMFSFEQRQEVAEAEMTAQKEIKKLSTELELLERKRAELTDGASRTVREAVLFLDKQADAQESIRLNYLVTGCGWSPTYAFRSSGDHAQVDLECNALIHQMTGEDWSGVQLTLSTASPALSSSGPGLAPFTVALREVGGDDGKPTGSELLSRLQTVRQKQFEANVRNRKADNLNETLGSGWAVNSAANDFQSLELASGKDLVNLLRSEDVGMIEGPSLTYRIESPVSLASRSDRQLVRIVKTSLASDFYHVATPVLTSFVYREAELVNTGTQDLLAGPIAVYLDDRYVGRAEIPTVARGQTFVVGFGVDPQVRSRRELVNKSEDVQGGNRELTFQYRLLVENFKEAPVHVRLFDRLPYSDRQQQVRVTLSPLDKDPLDDDPLYLRRERTKNILRWQIDVPAGAIREKARTIEYEFKVEFDRNFEMATVAAQEQQQREFEQLQRMRIAPSEAAPEAPEPPATVAP